MRYFEDMDGKLIFIDNGETGQVEVWGKDSFRVRSRMLGDIKDEYSALTEKIESITPVIRIAEDNKTAELTNGKLRAYLSRGGWGEERCRLLFIMKKDKYCFVKFQTAGLFL